MTEAQKSLLKEYQLIDQVKVKFEILEDLFAGRITAKTMAAWTESEYRAYIAIAIDKH